MKLSELLDFDAFKYDGVRPSWKPDSDFLTTLVSDWVFKGFEVCAIISDKSGFVSVHKSPYEAKLKARSLVKSSGSSVSSIKIKRISI